MGVLAHQGFGVVGGGVAQGGEGAGVAEIAEGDADVAQEAAALGAANRAVAEAFPKAGVVEGEQVEQVGRGSARSVRGSR